ncbi:MAG: glucoamylase family protein, partial [Vicinamibacterales bacterium]
MALLANLSAYDFGYISVALLLDRTQKTLATMGRMERSRRHFYNWYDTRSLKPLHPLYISTVDSGNLAGHLLVLRRGLIELCDVKILPPTMFGGIRDTVRILRDIALDPAKLGHRLESIEAELANPPQTLTAANALLQRLAVAAGEIAAASDGNEEFAWWARALDQAITDHRDDLLQIAPWTTLPPPPQQLQQAEGIREFLTRLDDVPTLRQLAALPEPSSPSIPTTDMPKEFEEWLTQLRLAITTGSKHAAGRIRALEAAAARCHEFADMEFTFLFDKSRDLFSIGYNVTDHRLDSSFYDLLASEARLISFVTIAQGQLAQDHWFALGRMLTTSGGTPALLSWSGSMFEYLMPLLVMPTYESTLLDRTYRAVVRRQINYGKQRGVPWGISESGYNTTDVSLIYQYRAFGVPGLGLKRGLAEDLVVTPYATALALMVAPEAACRNLERLDADGRQGAYGFYEAVDYTPSRQERGGKSVAVRSFMAHHQGMSFLSIAYLLLNRPMQRRFESDPMLRATDLLLHERIPKASAPVFPHAIEAGTTRAATTEAEGTMRVYTDPGSSTPEAHLLSNGRYHVMVSSAGGGYSRWRDLAVTRWREDPTRDCWGTFTYLRDVDSGKFWSVAYQPTVKPSKPYEAIFTQARA